MQRLSMTVFHLHRRTWIRLGLLAAIVAGLYPPWRYEVAGNPPRGVDVVQCVTLRSYAAAWSPPAVPPPYMTQSMACTPATIDFVRLGLTLAVIAVIAGLLATYRRSGRVS